jgi:hypothetical protein
MANENHFTVCLCHFLPSICSHSHLFALLLHGQNSAFGLTLLAVGVNTHVCNIWDNSVNDNHFTVHSCYFPASIHTYSHLFALSRPFTPWSKLCLWNSPWGLWVHMHVCNKSVRPCAWQNLLPSHLLIQVTKRSRL